MQEKDCIHMGTLSRPHGIKGEICVDWYADSPDPLRSVFYLQSGREAPRRVEGAKLRMHQGRPLLTLPQVADRTQAETLRGVRILVPRDALPPLSEDEAYLHDVLGLTVVDHDSNSVLGVLEHVEFTAGHDLWSIRTEDGREILFPAVEEFIVDFDLEAGEVRVSPPQGLLELYAPEAAPEAASEPASAPSSPSCPAPGSVSGSSHA